jgi:hypothetical protein
MAVVTAKEMSARRLPYAKRSLGCHRLAVGEAANAVRAKEFACH